MAVGSTVTFTYVVTNTGNVPLANVVVTDDKLGTIAGPAVGDANGNGLLDLTETWTYTTTATALAGQQTNTGTVTAQDPNLRRPPSPTTTRPTTSATPRASRSSSSSTARTPTRPTGPHVAVGSTVTFTYVVTNTGNVPLANVVVSDDKLGPITSFTGDTNGNGLLDLTETWTYTTTATALAGQQTNVGTVTGQDPNNPPGPPVTDDNPANYFGDAPAIQIVKFVNGQDADTPTGPHVAVGSTVTFTYVVTNTGNVPAGQRRRHRRQAGADHQLHRRHQRQRPARPDRDLDLHHDRHRPGRPADQRRHRHRPGPQQPARHRHRRQPGQLLRRRPGDQHRQVRQRPGRRQPDRAARARRAAR